MFDKLIESSKQRRRGRTGKYFLITSVAYAVMLTAFGVTAILWFDPQMAEAFSNITTIAVPPPPGGPSAPETRPQTATSSTVSPASFNPHVPPGPIPPPISVSTGLVAGPVGAPCTPPCGSGPGTSGGIIGAPQLDSEPPPPAPTKVSKLEPPPPTPTPLPTPKPTPAAPIKVSEGVVLGSALRKVYPTYPAIARPLRLSDAVEVQILISEEGRVIDAVVLKGHPLFREVSLQAARQWTFNPTQLSRVPVRINGIITFNFVFGQ